MIKTFEDYIKEIADEINNGKCYYIENPTIDDVKSLGDFDFIETKGLYFPVRINKRYKIDIVLGIPTVFFYDGYEIGDSVMGMLPETLSAEECLEELRGYQGRSIDPPAPLK